MPNQSLRGHEEHEEARQNDIRRGEMYRACRIFSTIRYLKLQVSCGDAEGTQLRPALFRNNKDKGQHRITMAIMTATMPASAQIYDCTHKIILAFSLYWTACRPVSF